MPSKFWVTVGNAAVTGMPFWAHTAVLPVNRVSKAKASNLKVENLFIAITFKK
jgi:hypothetical protein